MWKLRHRELGAQGHIPKSLKQDLDLSLPGTT